MLTPLASLVIIGICVHVCASFRSLSIPSRFNSFFYFRAGIKNSQRHKLMSPSPNDIFHVIPKFAVSAAFSPYIGFTDWTEDNFVVALENLISFVPTCSSSVYVKRPLLENKLSVILQATPDGRYTVVYGAKGVGKSTLVENMLSGRRGVVKVMLTPADDMDEIVTMLLSKILGVKASQDLLTASKIVDAVQKCKVVPTFIFEVERGGLPGQVLGIHAVRSLSKMLAPFSRCIIILSEAHAILEFGKDISREECVFVDEFTPEEATEMLKNMNSSLSTSQQQDLFQALGTNPAMLIMLDDELNQGTSLKAFIENYLEFATQDLVIFRHKQILASLKKYPDGVELLYFANQESEGVALSSPRAVGAAMKCSDAIIYRIEQTKYQLMSPAHRTAFQLYFPEVSMDKEVLN